MKEEAPQRNWEQEAESSVSGGLVRSSDLLAFGRQRRLQGSYSWRQDPM